MEEWEKETLEIDAHSHFEELLYKIKTSLSKKSDDDLLQIAIKKGVDLNYVTEHFPAYDVALKIKNNKWTPTPKQRAAITNVLAFFIATHNYDTDQADVDYGSDWEIDPDMGCHG